MRYCPKCDAEYQDSALLTCPDDGATLIDRAAWEALRGRPRHIGRLEPVLQLPDRFQIQELARALEQEGIETAITSDKAGTLGTLTTPGPMLFRLSVALADVPRATELVDEWRRGLDSTEAERQAEEAATRESTQHDSP